eukprot:SAG22_NODE_503_length_9694_cov_13.573736_4_plen_708_part_00
MTRSVAVAVMVTAAVLLCAGGGAAQKADIGSQLIDKGLDVPEGLKEIIGSMMVEMRGLKNENAALQNRTQIVEAGLSEAQREISWLKKDRDAFQNKTRVVEAELRKEKKKRMQLSIEVTKVRSALYQFSNKTSTDYKMITVRLGQCETDTHPFIKEMDRRRVQTDACSGQTLVTRVADINAACCSGGHRLLQDASEGCAHLPKHCSATCAPVFIAFQEECEEMMEQAGFDMQQVERLHESCLEQVRVDQGSCGAQIGRRVLQRLDGAAGTAVNTGATAAMIIPLTIITDENTGMLTVLGQNGRRSLQAGAETVQEFRCECGSSTDISACIPMCDESVHGFELLLTIDQSDIRVSCKLHLGLYSWAGAVSEGSYFGEDPNLFLSMLVSGAEGSYHLQLAVSPTVVIAVNLVAGQTAMMRGQADGIVWTYTGIGSAFHVGAGSELQMDSVTVDAASGLAFRIETGGLLTGTPRIQLGAITCSEMDADVPGLDCNQNGLASNSITLVGPIIIPTSGGALSLGSITYNGDVPSEFQDALITGDGEAGFYNLDLSANFRTGTSVTVQSSMHVTISGGDGTPAWTYVGSGDAFAVAAAGSLVISGVAVQGSLSETGGGSLSLQSVAGSISGLAVAESIFAMDAASTATLGGTIRFENAGAVALAGKTIVAGSSLAVSGAGTALSLSNCTLDASVSGHLVLSFSLRGHICDRHL